MFSGISSKREAKILLAENNNGEIVAQAIVRVETDTNNDSYAYFSTIYVTPEHRGQGIAKNLISEVIDWCNDKRLPYITYNTAETNERLINLYNKFEFNIVLRKSGMVQLKKIL